MSIDFRIIDLVYDNRNYTYNSASAISDIFSPYKKELEKTLFMFDQLQCIPESSKEAVSSYRTALIKVDAVLGRLPKRFWELLVTFIKLKSLTKWMIL